MNYLLPQITSLGFNRQSYQAIVDGSVLAIKRAHESLSPGYLDVANTTVLDANVNRSPYAYLANPASERAQYEHDVEKTMTMLRFQRASDGKNMGLLTWFSVHGTSALGNNTHVTGDNKGVAQIMFEKAMIGDASAADGFVAGFSQASVGDTSPNVLGAWCDDGSGEQCSFENSTCKGISQTCRGRGPEFQKLDLGISSCHEIGKRQFQPAFDLYVRRCILYVAVELANDHRTISTPLPHRLGIPRSKPSISSKTCNSSISNQTDANFRHAQRLSGIPSPPGPAIGLEHLISRRLTRGLQAQIRSGQ